VTANNYYSPSFVQTREPTTLKNWMPTVTIRSKTRTGVFLQISLASSSCLATNTVDLILCFSTVISLILPFLPQSECLPHLQLLSVTLARSKGREREEYPTMSVIVDCCRGDGHLAKVA
jgi:hypothetical protein